MSGVAFHNDPHWQLLQRAAFDIDLFQGPSLNHSQSFALIVRGRHGFGFRSNGSHGGSLKRLRCTS